jgi:hypothetical protein
MKAIRIIVLFISNMFTSYWLIRGIQNPDIIGFVKDHYENNIQPDTFILQVSGWLILFAGHICIIIYLIYKLNGLFKS